MCAQVISLSWHNHHSLLINAFNKLLESNTAVDCTIVAEGHQVKAHQVLLSSFSPFFEILFKEGTQEHPIIILTDTSYQDLRELIHYMYHGKLEIPHGRINNLLETASYLQIRGLCDGSKHDSIEKLKETLPLHTYCNSLNFERNDDAEKSVQYDIMEGQSCQTLLESSVHHVGQLPIHCMSSNEALEESFVQRLPSSLPTSLSSEPNTLPLDEGPVVKVEPQDETCSTESVYPHEPESQENEEMNIDVRSTNSQYQGTNICFSTNVIVKREENNEYVPLPECASSLFHLPSAEIPSPTSITCGRLLDVPSVKPELDNASRDSPFLVVDPLEESDDSFHSELDSKPEEIAMQNGASEHPMEEETYADNEHLATMRSDCSGNCKKICS